MRLAGRWAPWVVTTNLSLVPSCPSEADARSSGAARDLAGETCTTGGGFHGGAGGANTCGPYTPHAEFSQVDRDARGLVHLTSGTSARGDLARLRQAGVRRDGPRPLAHVPTSRPPSMRCEKSRSSNRTRRHETSARLGPASSSFGMRPAAGPYGRRVTDPGEATIAANLLSGAVRNPLGHRSVQCDDATEAVEMLLIADLRMRQLGSISSRSVRLNLTPTMSAARSDSATDHSRRTPLRWAGSRYPLGWASAPTLAADPNRSLGSPLRSGRRVCGGRGSRRAPRRCRRRRRSARPRSSAPG